jgi:ribonuclease Z
VILTHDHVDHVYGLPHLLQALKIGGYEDELELYAPPQTLATVDDMLAAHRQRRPGYPRLQARPVDGAGEVEITSAGVTLRFAPMRHGRDTVAVRCDAGEGSVCHSADTAPCAELARLARDVGLLLHDCAGPQRLHESFAGVHSSAREAGEAARAARAGALALIHLGVADNALVEECVAEARAAFDGPVSAACDGDRWRLPERS